MFFTRIWKMQGLAIINVLTEGTTFMGMFKPNNYYLWGRRELEDQFKGGEDIAFCP